MSHETAFAVLRDTDGLTIEHMCAVACIPAPGGEEAERGQWLADRLRELGLEPQRDEVGNVVAVSPAADPAAGRLVIASHLDTVFDRATPLEIRRQGDRLLCPGISDNARGIAGLLAIARALHAAGWPLRIPICFLGTVGEEGAGDLRGVKHFMQREGGTTALFIALDGAGAARIITTGVGSRRLRVTLRGPGGHSWSDWGEPNAIHAAGRAIGSLAALSVPAEPRTTLSVGRISGGTSINALPANCWLEIDLRSEDRAALIDLETHVRRLVERAGAQERVECRIDVFGDRPAGRTSDQHPIVCAAYAATLGAGLQPELASSSTDANVPMAEGVPAIAIGAGGAAGGTHTTEEWYDNSGGVSGLERALRIVLDLAG
jgi:tripeptide aminopeptidase